LLSSVYCTLPVFTNHRSLSLAFSPSHVQAAPSLVSVRSGFTRIVSSSGSCFRCTGSPLAHTQQRLCQVWSGNEFHLNFGPFEVDRPVPSTARTTRPLTLARQRMNGPYDPMLPVTSRPSFMLVPQCANKEQPEIFVESFGLADIVARAVGKESFVKDVFQSFCTEDEVHSRGIQGRFPVCVRVCVGGCVGLAERAVAVFLRSVADRCLARPRRDKHLLFLLVHATHSFHTRSCWKPLRVSRARWSPLSSKISSPKPRQTHPNSPRVLLWFTGTRAGRNRASASLHWKTLPSSCRCARVCMHGCVCVCECECEWCVCVCVCVCECECECECECVCVCVCATSQALLPV
jgi:hypothetical protein